MSELLNQIQEFVRRFPIADPVPRSGRVEVGAMVHEWLARMGTTPSSAPPWGPSSVAALYGVPVVPRADMDPREWRLLDRNGDFLAEGAVDGGGDRPEVEAAADGILDRIDAAVDDREHGPDAMHWSPEPAGVDPAAAAQLADFQHLDGHFASMRIFDEIQDYVQGSATCPTASCGSPADWEVAHGRADLPRDRIHALAREPVLAAALAVADCDPLHRPAWLIDRQRETAEVLGILATARNLAQEWPGTSPRPSRPCPPRS